MDSYKVEPDTLGSLASSLEQHATAMEAAVQELAQTANMLAASWTGEAADAYQSRQSKWFQDMGTKIDTLRQAAAAARESGLGYDDADTTVGGAWGMA